MNSNWPILSKLFFSLVYLADEIDESFAHFRYALFRPIGELKLAYRTRLAILHINKLHLMSSSQNINNNNPNNATNS